MFQGTSKLNASSCTLAEVSLVLQHANGAVGSPKKIVRLCAKLSIEDTTKPTARENIKKNRETKIEMAFYSYHAHGLVIWIAMALHSTLLCFCVRFWSTLQNNKAHVHFQSQYNHKLTFTRSRTDVGYRSMIG
jgi:hypothetical protein